MDISSEANFQNSEFYFRSVTGIRLLINVLPHFSLFSFFVPFLNKANTITDIDYLKQFFFPNRKNPNVAMHKLCKEHCVFLQFLPFLSLTPGWPDLQTFNVRKSRIEGVTIYVPQQLSVAQGP